LADLCIFYDDSFKLHKPWFHHPENPGRLELIVSSLKRYGVWSRAEVVEPPRSAAARDLALRIHDESYVSEVERASKSGDQMLDPDTYVNRHTYSVALLALAAADAAAREVVRGGCRAAMVLARPPGHHAGRYGRAMGAPTLGFCIFNASALAAVTLADMGYKVLLVDFDLHHGNGTQDILYSDPRVVHVDLHQDPATVYPGSGWPWQSGDGEARGTKINVILPPGAGDDALRRAYEEALDLAKTVSRSYDYVVFSAGFDAYRGDGLGLLQATSRFFHWVASATISEVKPHGIVAVWEGGYSVGIEKGAPAFAAALLGEDDPVGDEATTSHPSVMETLENNLRALRRSVGA
jgi:acetoin utilization deacetylase AcuC-like enzyme